MHLHAILLCTHCVQTTYNVCSTYKYSSTYKYLAKYLSISTSTLGKSRKYLSKVQVLSNLYLSVLKYKYSCTWPHVCCIDKNALHFACLSITKVTLWGFSIAEGLALVVQLWSLAPLVCKNVTFLATKTGFPLYFERT